MTRGLMRLCAALCLCALLLSVAGVAEQSSGAAADITSKCRFKVSEGDKGKLRDDSVRTTWKYSHEGAYIGIQLPKDTPAGWLRVEWMFDPRGYEIIEYDGDLNALRTRDQTASFPNIYTVLPLLPETRYIQLKMTASNQQVCQVRVYSAGELPRTVQLWQPPVDKADVMVLSTHQDDELIFLGGTIPYYATALKKPTVVVYMTNCSRSRRREALNALWVMGVKNYPDFINFKDEKVSSIEAGIALWGGQDAILGALVARIRRYKPEVIVTQDLDGEYGHNQHRITARAAMYAIEAAADPERFPESYEKYGAWQVKKLYHHLYGENQIEMDWNTPLDSLNGYSPLKVAQLGMAEHKSQTKYYAVKNHGKYDNAKFGLYFTTVGEDVRKDDFLENIDPNASSDYIAEHGTRDMAELWALADAEEPEEADDAGLGDLPEAGELEGDEATPASDGAAEDPDLGAEADIPADGAGEGADAPAPADGSFEGADAPVQASSSPESGGGAAVPPSPVSERGGVAGPAVAMIAVGVAAIGGGGFYLYRLMSRRRRHRRWRGRGGRL